MERVSVLCGMAGRPAVHAIGRLWSTPPFSGQASLRYPVVSRSAPLAALLCPLPTYIHGSICAAEMGGEYVCVMRIWAQ